jgi:hypothetical protein
MLLWFLVTLTALAAHAQPIPQVSTHGLIVDDQGTFVFDTPATPLSPGACMNQRELALLGRLVQSTPNSVFRLPAASATPCAEFETWLEPLPENFQPNVAGGFAAIDRGAVKSTLHRFVRDNARRIYVGYSVTIEAASESGTYRVSFGPSAAPSLPQDWTIGSLAEAPVPQIMRDGDELPVELYPAGPNESGLIDYLRVGARDKMPHRQEAPRDSYAEDAEFTLAQPRLSVNGVAQPSAAVPETIHGAAVWIYVPGKGRYVLAFAPHADLGFKRAGEASGSLLTLVIDGNVFRIACADRIAFGGGIYNIYSLRNPQWEPADPSDRSRPLLGVSLGIDAALGR